MARGPPLDFVEHARELAPDVQVVVLAPGESVDLGVLSRRPSVGGPTVDGGSRPVPTEMETGSP